MFAQPKIKIMCFDHDRIVLADPLEDTGFYSFICEICLYEYDSEDSDQTICKGCKREIQADTDADNWREDY